MVSAVVRMTFDSAVYIWMVLQVAAPLRIWVVHNTRVGGVGRRAGIVKKGNEKKRKEGKVKRKNGSKGKEWRGNEVKSHREERMGELELFQFYLF